MPEESVIFVMGSIHRVLKAEKLLKVRSVTAEIVVTPRQLSNDCGMVVKIAPLDRARALEVFLSAGLSCEKVFAEKDGAFEELRC
jgi:hypothetical protein